jgi:hypothetical protein
MFKYLEQYNNLTIIISTIALLTFLLLGLSALMNPSITYSSEEEEEEKEEE